LHIPISNKNPIADEQHKPLEPYIGPRPFKRDKDDQSRFFGRNVESNEIVSLITSHRLVLVYAQSGAGKTSIFNAQVTPILENYGFEVLPMARVQTTTIDVTNTSNASNLSTSNPVSYHCAHHTQPNNRDKINIENEYRNNNNVINTNNLIDKIENLYIYNAMQSLRPDIDSTSLLNTSLFEFLDKHFPYHKDKNGYPRPQVVVFDQLEELFGLYPSRWIDQQKEFFQQIVDSLDNNPILRIVFIIREDFLAQLDPFKSVLPEKLRPRFRLERLNRNEAVMAIRGPLSNVINNMDEQEKGAIEEEIKELVYDLLKINVESLEDGSSRQLEGEVVEPIHLQVVCRRWWKEISTGKSIYDKTHLKALTDIDSALEEFYDDAITDVTKKINMDEGFIRKLIGEKFITSSGTRAFVHKGAISDFIRQIDESITNKKIDESVYILEKKYLIRPETRSGAKWYELTHDKSSTPSKSQI